MDPLSVTASAIAVLQLTTSIIKSMRGFYRDAKAAPKEVADLIEELTAFRGVLQSLETTSRKADGRSQASLRHQDPAQSPGASSRLPTVSGLLEKDAALSICYGEMQAFLDKLTKTKSKIKKALKWPFQKEEIFAVVGRLRKLQSVLATAIGVDNVNLSLKIDDGVSNITNALHTTKSDELSRNIKSWLSAPDPSSNYNAARYKHQKDTGVWFLNAPQFGEWIEEPASLLWTYGKAGSGKTILSSTIIHYLSSIGSGESTMAYFYFDFQVREKQYFDGCIRSLLVQLMFSIPMALETLQRLYNTHSKGTASPSTGSLMSALEEILNAAGSVYLVLDALDECSDRPELLKRLIEIRNWQNPSLHLLVTSRKETDIEDALEGRATSQIFLEESVVNSDIRAFTREQIATDIQLLKWSDEIRGEIESTLTKDANGMFRWVVCQLDAIRVCKKLTHLRQTMASLPKTLDETYDRILTNIPEEYVEDVRRVLQLLICSFYPLALEEVADAMAIKQEEEPYYDSNNRLREDRDLLTICSGLVTVTTSRRYAEGKGHEPRSFDIEELRLSHFSIKEYLISNQTKSGLASRICINETACHETVADLCICYLLRMFYRPSDLESESWQYSYIGKKIMQLSNNIPFGPYAAMFWSWHMESAGSITKSALHDKVAILIGEPASISNIVTLCQFWFSSDEFHDLEIYGKRRYDAGFHDDEFISPVYLAASLGRDDHVKRFLTLGESSNSYGPEGFALALAARRGHLSTVELLLRNGASVDAIKHHRTLDGVIVYSQSALQSALENQHEDIIKMLLSEGASADVERYCLAPEILDSDPETLDHYYQYNTPLQAAIMMSNMTIVETLLGRDANVNACAGARGTALMCALDSSAPAITTQRHRLIELLLKAGADPNAGRPLSVPLMLAIAHRDEPAQRLLLRYGAVIESMKPNIILKAFREIVEKTENDTDDGVVITIIMTLARLGVDLAANIPITTLAKHDCYEAIQFLLSMKVDVNLRGDYCNYCGDSALHRAVGRGGDVTNTLEFLLKAGANVNDGTMQVAASRNNTKVMHLLLQNGALMDRRHQHGHTAIQAAAMSRTGKTSALKFLLDAGATTQGALHLAVRSMNVACANLLIDHGVSIEEKDAEGIHH